MRSRSGGVLSASALVALGTSLLLVALIGLGLSELGNSPSGGATGPARAEAAAVVVPAVTARRHAAAGKVRHPATSPRPSTPALTPVSGGVAPKPTTTVGGQTAAATTTASAARRTTKATSPTPSPTRSHGRGKGNANPHGRDKPAKH